MTLLNQSQNKDLYPQDVVTALDEMLYPEEQPDLAVQESHLPHVTPASVEDDELAAQVARDQAAYELSLREQEIQRRMVHEDTMPSSHVDGFDYSTLAMSVLVFAIIVGLAFFAQNQIKRMSSKPAPTSGVVIEDSASVPRPVPAYPTVMTEPSNNPNQAPSPLPYTNAIETVRSR